VFIYSKEEEKAEKKKKRKKEKEEESLHVPKAASTQCNKMLQYHIILCKI
jgi:hypothetical protein